MQGKRVRSSDWTWFNSPYKVTALRYHSISLPGNSTPAYGMNGSTVWVDILHCYAAHATYTALLCKQIACSLIFLPGMLANVHV